MSLEQRERWFWDAVRGKRPPRDLSLVVRRGSSLEPLRRLGIYRSAYFLRQTQVLEESYERTRELVGEARFRELCLAYLLARPSTSPAIEHLGATLVDFLARLPEAERPEPAVLDVARLEWARLRALLAPDTPAPSTPEALARVLAGNRVPSLAPSLILLHIARRALALFERRDEEVDGGEVSVAVHRPRYAVSQLELPEDEALALEVVARGGSPDELAACFPGPDSVARTAGAVAGWLGRGWLVAATLALFTSLLVGCGESAEPDGVGFATGPTMRPGDDCLRCHSTGSDYPTAPEFAAAGTVFSRVDAATSEGVAGVHVELLTPQGDLIERLVTNAVGNFYTQSALMRGFRVVLEHDGQRLEMPCPPPAGNCGACHSLPPIGEAQGRIYVPSGGVLAEPPLDCKTWKR